MSRSSVEVILGWAPAREGTAANGCQRPWSVVKRPIWFITVPLFFFVSSSLFGVFGTRWCHLPSGSPLCQGGKRFLELTSFILLFLVMTVTAAQMAARRSLILSRTKPPGERRSRTRTESWNKKNNKKNPHKVTVIICGVRANVHVENTFDQLCLILVRNSGDIPWQNSSVLVHKGK